jgi:acetyl esterase
MPPYICPIPVDPQIARLIELRREAGLRPASQLTPAEARAQLIAAAAARPPVVPRESCEVQDLVADGGELVIRRYASREDATGSVVYFHGGGWVIGDLDSYEQLCLKLAVDTGCDVFSVAYRLAPEHAFPAAADDALAAVVEVARRTPPGRKLIVVGDSAGGNLAAVAALRARDAGGPTLALQVLLYPITDHDLDRPSYRENGDRGYILSTDDMRWFWGHYVPDPDARSHPLASPLRVDDLRGLPPAFVVVAGYDPLRDEGVEYARRLGEAGVRVDLREFPDAVHGFLGMLGAADVAEEGMAVVSDAIVAAVAS